MKSLQLDILVAHYNGSKFIKAQIDSILSSRMPQELDLRITIVDDGSKPDQLHFLKETFANYPQISVLQNERNLGVIKTFEHGMRNSHADVIMLCDQDDVWLEDKIEKSWQLLKPVFNEEPALVFTNLRPVTADLRNTIHERMFHMDFSQEGMRDSLLFQNVVAGCTTIFNRKLKDLCLPFPANIPMHDHWIAVCAAFGGRVGFVSDPTILYRQHSANTVGTPKRTLSHYLKKPLATLQALHHSLNSQSLQGEALAQRLRERGLNTHTSTVDKASHAFRFRNLRNLIYLIRTKTFRANPITLTILSAAYLLTRYFKSEVTTRRARRVPSQDSN